MNRMKIIHTLTATKGTETITRETTTFKKASAEHHKLMRQGWTVLSYTTRAA